MSTLTMDNCLIAVGNDLDRLHRVVVGAEPCPLTLTWNSGKHKSIKNQRAWHLSEIGVDDDVLNRIETRLSSCFLQRRRVDHTMVWSDLVWNHEGQTIPVTVDYIHFVLVRNFLDHYVAGRTPAKRQKLDHDVERRDFGGVHLQYIGTEAADVRVGIDDNVEATITVSTPVGTTNHIDTVSHTGTGTKMTTIRALKSGSILVISTIGDTEILRREITVSVSSGGGDDSLPGTWNDAQTATIDLSQRVPLSAGDILDSGLFRVIRCEW